MAIYKDEKRKTWYFRVYIEENGTRKQKTRSGFLTKGEAKNAEFEFLKNQQQKKDNNLNLSFQQLYDTYMQHQKQKLKFQSFRTLENRMRNHILPYFKDYNIQDITNKVYLNWKDIIIKKGFSYKYNSSLHVAMVGILNYAKTFYDLETNIASKIGNFSKKDYIEKTDFWNYSQFTQFINEVTEFEYYVFFTTFYNTGMRIGEILALDWHRFINDKIKIDRTLIRGRRNRKDMFNTPKTKTSQREIKLDEHTCYLLNKLKEYYSQFVDFSEDWFIFGGLNPLSFTTIERKKNYYCRLANVKQIKLHDFRHSHATQLLSMNTPITVISKRLGHSDVATTLNIYSHFIPTDEEKAVNSLNNLQKNIKTREFQEIGKIEYEKTIENSMVTNKYGGG